MQDMPHDFQPLPPYSDPRVSLRRALPAIRAAEEISVTEAAEKYMNVNIGGQWQPFRRDVAPYMVEPTDMIASRLYRGLAFCGPSQSGKTMMLQTACAWVIRSNPGRMAFFQMTRDAAEEFERNKLDPMIRNSPELKSRKAKGRGADNTFQKLYTGGTQLTLDWPTITKLSSSTIRLCMGTDYDHFPVSIGGEGDAFSMMRARIRSYMSRGMAVVESSPGAPLLNEDWKPETVHDCPPVSYGVLSIYPKGTRARWYWPCPHCGESFEPTFQRLNYPKSLDPVEAGEAAEMVCPNCDFRFGHHLKRELNAEGRWFHEAADGRRVVPIGHDEIRKTDTLSYWLNGAAAAFATWGELVTQFEQAVETFDRTGDEENLKTALNTGQAMPYVPRSASSENEVTLQGLKDKAQKTETPKGVAPSWTRYILVSIDVQGTYFDVGVTAFGEKGRHQPIDRFELNIPPEGAPCDAEKRGLKPFEIAEDWEALSPLADMAWPVDGKEYSLRAKALGVDMQGGGSTTENAYKFYRGRRKAKQETLWWLTRGSDGKHTDRVWLKAPERVSATARKGRKVAADIEILNMATDRLKDAVSTSLIMTEMAENHCRVPLWMTEAQLIEFTAERRGAKGWEKRPGMVRNESLDHLVQARAMHIQIEGETIKWISPPPWARGGRQNVNAVVLDAEPEPAEEPGPVVVEKKRKTGRRIPRKLF